MSRAKKIDLASIALSNTAIREKGEKFPGDGDDGKEEEEEMSVVDAGEGVVEMLKEFRANVEKSNAEAAMDEEEEEEEEVKTVSGGGL